MSRTKQASKRLVQPQPEHYITNDKGEKILVGIYTNAHRNKFMSIHISLYLTRHPHRTQKQARQVAFTKWRNLVFTTLDEQYKKTLAQT